MIDASKRFVKLVQNLKYFKIIVKWTDEFYDLRDILQNCHNLEGLVIEFPYDSESDIDDDESLVGNDCKILFDILAKHSPMRLYKFKLQNIKTFIRDNLKSFFDNWKDRPPMLFQTIWKAF
ncbi:278_t:CDS:1 [Funneliformis mosseae]|uniref:278_t:CDS:1 n=1 Tax=Funneliformis mosseae TaxID=27381 RepID=A0A9N9BTM9_FUNMO|nr:278_t:CDS:1 [Funneliformis mosseae]